MKCTTNCARAASKTAVSYGNSSAVPRRTSMAGKRVRIASRNGEADRSPRPRPRSTANTPSTRLAHSQRRAPYPPCERARDLARRLSQEARHSGPYSVRRHLARRQNSPRDGTSPTKSAGLFLARQASTNASTDGGSHEAAQLLLLRVAESRLNRNSTTSPSAGRRSPLTNLGLQSIISDANGGLPRAPPRCVSFDPQAVDACLHHTFEVELHVDMSGPNQRLM